MPNPTLCLSRFTPIFNKRRHVDEYHAKVEDPSRSGMSAYMADIIHRAKTLGSEPRLWSFATYTGKKLHTKANIKNNTAAVLEYPLSRRDDVLDAMDELGFHFYLINTESVSENKVAVIIPLAEPIDNEDKTCNRYSRLVSVLLERLNIRGAYEGCIAATYHIMPTYTAQVEAYSQREYLDAHAFIRETKDLNAKASDYINRAEPSNDSDDDNLFSWGAA